tara:strand:- start:118 stop:546 length:429 start_codon:yes stop_codon:yes gene_type:complete
MTRKNKYNNAGVLKKYNNKETEMIPAWNGDIMRHPIALIIYKYAVRHFGIGNEFRLYNMLELPGFKNEVDPIYKPRVNNPVHGYNMWAVYSWDDRFRRRANNLIKAGLLTVRKEPYKTYYKINDYRTVLSPGETFNFITSNI